MAAHLCALPPLLWESLSNAPTPTRTRCSELGMIVTDTASCYQAGLAVTTDDHLNAGPAPFCTLLRDASPSLPSTGQRPPAFRAAWFWLPSFCIVNQSCGMQVHSHHSIYATHHTTREHCNQPATSIDNDKHDSRASACRKPLLHKTTISTSSPVLLTTFFWIGIEPMMGALV